MPSDTNRKRRKRGEMGWFKGAQLNPNAGDVEKNNAIFNSMQPTEAPVAGQQSGGMAVGEDLNNRKGNIMKFIKKDTGADERTMKAIKDYRKYAGLKEDAEIDKIDEWALSSASVDNAFEKCDLRKALKSSSKKGGLKEDYESVEDAARKLDAEAERVEDKSQLEKLLDEKLRVALWKQKRGKMYDFPNVLLVSDPGFGKTAVVRQWARDNNINLFNISLSNSGPETFGGIVARDPKDPRYATTLGTRALDALDRPRSVLFLDEYNRAKTDIRGLVLTLIQEHKLPDPAGEDGFKYFPNFLFTIAAMNYDDDTDVGAKRLGGAEKNRFDRFEVSPSPLELLRHLRKTYTADIAEEDDPKMKLELQGKLALAEALLSDKRFRFTDHQRFADAQDDTRFNQTSYRSITQLIENTDGTKQDLLNKWSRFCDYAQKNTIEDILSEFVDIEDKANSALKQGTESDVFTSAKSDWDKISDYMSSI